MKQFAEIQFPSDISYGSQGGPEFLTDIVLTHSGYEHRTSYRSYGRIRYNVVYGVKTEAQLTVLLDFFRARQGRAQGFRFKDWLDYRLEDQVIAVGDGTRKTFALIKTYGADQEVVRPITKPVHGTVVVRVGSEMVEVSVDYRTGVVVFVEAPEEGAEIKVDGEFDVPMRFDVDWLSASLVDYGVFSVREVGLVEVMDK